MMSLESNNNMTGLQKEQVLNKYDKMALEETQRRINEDIQVRMKAKSTVEGMNILTCLRNHFIFYNLSEDEIDNIKERMLHVEVNAGHILYRPRDYGTCFFIVETGQVEVAGDNNDKKVFKPNQGFGELALLYNTQRNSTAIAVEEASLWVIDRVSFRQAVEEVIIREYTENKKSFESVRFFSNLSADQKDIISSSLIRQKFYKGQTIISEGDPGSTFYFIKEGSASVLKAGKVQRKLSKGDSFGQQSLYYNTMRQFTIRADEDTVCLLLGRDTLHRIMGDNIYEVTFKNFIRWAFEKNASLSQLTRDTQEKIIDEMKISSFKAQESVFKRGVVGFQKLVVVIEGTLKKLRNGAVMVTKGQCFGEEFLKDSNKILDDEIVMQNYGVIAEITDADFFEAVGHRDYQKLVEQKKQENYSVLERLEVKNRFRDDLRLITPADLQVTYRLNSAGQFGPLYEVKHKAQEFVLKVISKQELRSLEVEQFAIDEAGSMSELSCPFISQLGRALQSSHHIYLLMELVRGQDLYEVLKSIGLLSTEDSQFYTATIVLILEYLAEKGVICRDIKPENFMVDRQGYLKLINLPAAKKVEKDHQGAIKKTYTIIGTPHYMAPDIVVGKGYNNMADLWSLGVCLYEFLCGSLPFGDASEGAYEIYEAIMQNELNFPPFLHDKKAKKLIEQLLSHNPLQRHGGSFQALKRHSWFESFPWKALTDRNKEALNPPMLPAGRHIYADSKQVRLGELVRELERDLPSAPLEDKWRGFDSIV